MIGVFSLILLSVSTITCMEPPESPNDHLNTSTLSFKTPSGAKTSATIFSPPSTTPKHLLVATVIHTTQQNGNLTKDPDTETDHATSSSVDLPNVLNGKKPIKTPIEQVLEQHKPRTRKKRKTKFDLQSAAEENPDENSDSDTQESDHEKPAAEPAPPTLVNPQFPAVYAAPPSTTATDPKLPLLGALRQHSIQNSGKSIDTDLEVKSKNCCVLL